MRTQGSVDLEAALAEWAIHLRAERKSPQTVKTYTDGVRRFLAWCVSQGLEPDLDPSFVTRFTVDLMDTGASPAGRHSRAAGVRPES